MLSKDELYEKLTETFKIPLSGWDFSSFKSIKESELPWSYYKIVKKYLKKTSRLLDIGTGGGEFLLTLNHPYEKTYVTEGYDINYDLCLKKLAPLGVNVYNVDGSSIMPFETSFFNIVINRHESYNIFDIKRILKKRGIFITQQVGYKNDQSLRSIINQNDENIKGIDENFNCVSEANFIWKTGFRILKEEEYFPKLRFYDIFELVLFCRMISFEFDDFTLDKKIDQIYQIYQIIEEKGYFETVEHRFLIVARKV
ncbi:class I SAM-dependent methyltransferase [Acholeplasma sp. OttesenSCG-928-E16]|nr:class I SAM-dependent methyltransferase [Acholeplasma sp. OttesenSCG-928-E16]